MRGDHRAAGGLRLPALPSSSSLAPGVGTNKGSAGQQCASPHSTEDFVGMSYFIICACKGEKREMNGCRAGSFSANRKASRRQRGGERL